MELHSAQPKMRVRGPARLDSGLLIAGVTLLAVGVVAPLFLTVETFSIYETLNRAIGQEEKIFVLLAAFKLVLLNTIRAAPHYLGAFFLAEAINDWDVKGRSVLSILVVCVTIPGVYFIIEGLYSIRYDFGAPALSLIFMLLIFSKIRFDFVNVAKKVLLLVLIIFSVQFLDVMPALKGLPIGRGESSFDIKLVSSFLGADAYLQGMAVTCALLFLFVAMLLLMLINDENNIKSISELKEQHEQALMETRMRILENRTYMELNHLVHDLKSPLTSMQALVGVVKMSCEDRGRERDVDCLKKVEGNIERMSSMISEILYEDRLQVVSVREIITGLLAQISTAEYVDLVRVENRVPEDRIAVNVIRFSRALVNLIENSFYAVDRENGEIWLRIAADELEGHPGVRFEVSDNGIGIAQELLGGVWAKSFSTRSSHGLGLSFVRKVVEQCEGVISIQSVQRQGTQVEIILPLCEEKRQG